MTAGLASHDEVSAVVADEVLASSALRRLAEALGLLAFYVAVIAVVSWPLVASLRTHHLSSWWGPPFDLYQGTWAMAWQIDALFRGGATIADANIYFPDRAALFYGQTGWGALPLFAPVYLLTRDPTLAVNVTFLLGLALTAWGVHLVVRRWSGSHLAGGVAALTLVANPWLTTYFGPTAPQWVALVWLPWVALLAARRHARLVDALWLVPLVVLQLLTDPVYLLPAVLGPLGVQALARMARSGTRADGLRMAGALVVAALLTAPVLLPYLHVAAMNPDLARQTNWLGGIAPLPLLPGHSVYVAPITAVLLVLGIGRALARGRSDPWPIAGAWATASVWAIVGFLLAVPPVQVIDGVGMWEMPTPMGLLQTVVPIAGTMRATARLGIAALVGFAMLAGLAFAEVHRVVASRIPDRRWSVVAVVAMLTLYLSVLFGTSFDDRMRWPRRLRPAPTVPSSFEPFLRSGGSSLLQLPLAPQGEAPAPHAVAMYRSIGRWYPLINGYASYWPEGFPSRMRLAQHLPDADATAELVRRAGLGFVWVELRQLTPHDRRRWDRLLARGGHGLVPVATTDASVLYRVDPPRRNSVAKRGTDLVPPAR